MIVETTALTTIGNALYAVYTAYSMIKSNKDRCKQLVDRCQLIVDRLKAVLETEHDIRVVNRIGDLEKAFNTTAETIRKVGEQNYITSLLRTEENTALIEDAQRALTELITTLSLETIIDVSAWQRENEVAVRKEFAQVKSMVNQLDRNFTGELAAHGATIDQLAQVVQNMAKKLGEPVTPLSASAPEIPLTQEKSRVRSWSSPVGVRPSIASILDQVLPQDTSEGGNGGDRRTSRPNSSSRARPSLLVPPMSAGYEAVRLQSRLRPFTSSPLVQSHMFASPLQVNEEAVADSEGEDDPDDPPPPYTALSWEDEVAAAYERMEEAPSAPVRSTNSRSSTQAIRPSGSPDEVPSSPGLSGADKPLPDNPFLKVRQSLKRKEINNFSAMKTIGQFGKINTRVMVEMWLSPKNRTYDNALSLESFEPLERDKLQLIRSRAHQNREDAYSQQASNTSQQIFNHVLLLCPRDYKPTVIVTETKQALPQQVVKAYIIDSVEPMTLVSVVRANNRQWLLIPYYPDMLIKKAKECVQKHFNGASVISCTLPGQSVQLTDTSTLRHGGVRVYDHNLSMILVASAQ